MVKYWAVPGVAFSLCLLFDISLGADEPKEPARTHGFFRTLAFSPDSSSLAVGGDDISVYDVKTGDLVTRWKPPPMTRTISFVRPSQDVVVEAGDSNVIRFRKIGEDNPIRELKIHQQKVEHIVVAADGSLAASTAGRKPNDRLPDRSELRLWKINSGEVVGSVDVDAVFLCPVFAPDGGSLAIPKFNRNPSRGDDAQTNIEILRVPDFKPLQSVTIPGIVSSIDYCPNGKE